MEPIDWVWIVGPIAVLWSLAGNAAWRVSRALWQFDRSRDKLIGAMPPRRLCYLGGPLVLLFLAYDVEAYLDLYTDALDSGPRSAGWGGPNGSPSA